ncbi:hypothetical protein IMZ48_31505 [Candidatus Bathyarchaeota archaeon]|nr:hypothetical protein [Candidatus Bathyarchaeota archaeon]
MKKKNTPSRHRSSPTYTSSQQHRRGESPQTHPPRRAPPIKAPRPTKPVARPALGLRPAEPLLIVVVRERGLHLGAVPGREQDADAVGGRGVNVLGRQHLVVQPVAVGPVVVFLDAVRDGDGEVEDGIVVLVVEAEVLPDGDLAWAC